MRKYFFLVAAVAVLEAHADVSKYMYGSADAPAEQRAFDGFVYVPDMDVQFVRGAKAKLTKGWAYSASGGATTANPNSGSLPADTLLEHGVCVDRDVVLSVPFAKDGPVKVHVWIGDWFKGWPRLYKSRVQEIYIRHGGKTVYSETISPASSYRNWCKLEDYSYSKKDGIWDRIVKPVLTEVSFDAVAKDGAVRLDLQGILLTAVAIASSEAEMQALLAETEQARRSQFAERYPWKPKPDEPMPEGVDLSANCVIFQRNGMDAVNPWSRPRVGEVTDTIRAFAAKDEQEPFRFGVLPLKDYKTLEVAVGDFQGPEGTVLKTSEIADFWRERYKERGSEQTRGKIDQMWRLDPLSYVLQKNGPQNGEAGTPRMYDLDVFVPADAKAGDYFATLTVKGDGKVIRTGRLQLKVLPFRLRYDGAAQYGFQAGYGDSSMDAPGTTQEIQDRGIREICNMTTRYRFACISMTGWTGGFQQNHKLGTITGEPGHRMVEIAPENEKSWNWWMSMACPKGQRYVMIQPAYLFQNLGWQMEVTRNYKKVRDKKWFTPERQKNFELELEDGARIMRTLTDFMSRKGYPTPYWNLGGEIDNYGAPGAEAAARWGEALKKVGCESIIVINGPLAAKLTPSRFDHVWANPATPVTEDLKGRIEKYGHGFGAHNCGDTRFQAGFQFWRTGAEGRYQETQFYTRYMLPFVNLPWNYNTAQAYPSLDGSYRPSLPWLLYRDGRDDYLYLYTLERTLEENKGSAAVRAEAEKFLSFLRKKIKFDPRAYHAAKFDGIEATAETLSDVWNGVSIERYRWHVADLISRLEVCI